MTSAVGRCQYCGPQGAATVAHDWDQLQQQLDALRAEVERLRDRADRSGRALTDVYSHLSAATARAEAAEGRAAGLYRALCETVKASGGVTQAGLSDEFLILGVPAEMAARKKAQEAAERERDEAQAQARHWREAAVTENERAMEALNAVAEAQAHAADLRGALEGVTPKARVSNCWCSNLRNVDANGHSSDCLSLQKVVAAISRTPPQSLGRIKAEVLREAAKQAHERIQAIKQKASPEFIAGLIDAKEILLRMADVADHVGRGGKAVRNG
jgi:hypothetical protein